MLLLVGMVLLCFQTSYAIEFPKEKRIYILDITESMSGFDNNPNIFEKVKTQLVKAITELDEKNTEIVVVPYTNKPYPAITGTKRDVILQLQNLQTKREDTNIADAWNAGVAQLDSSKVNYMFLLTDGKHNFGDISNYAFCKTLKEWENVSMNKWFFAFYVMLTENAMDQNIRNIADTTPNMWNIAGLDINVTFVLSEKKYKVNVFDKKTKVIYFKCNHPKELEKLKGFTFTMDKNPYYALEKSAINSKEGRFELRFSELIDHKKIPAQVKVKLHAKYDNRATPLIFFTPEVYTFTIENIGRKTMTFHQTLDKSSFQKNKK